LELPVVTSNAGGIPEGLIEGKTGYVLEQRDMNGLSNKLEMLMQDPNARKKMGVEGRNFVIKTFDINPLGRKLEDLYYSSIEAAKRNRA
jgi:colanic acid/amylovoran biosynthesis glycosyltransferase